MARGLISKRAARRQRGKSRETARLQAARLATGWQHLALPIAVAEPAPALPRQLPSGAQIISLAERRTRAPAGNAPAPSRGAIKGPRAPVYERVRLALDRDRTFEPRRPLPPSLPAPLPAPSKAPPPRRSLESFEDAVRRSSDRRQARAALAFLAPTAILALILVDRLGPATSRPMGRTAPDIAAKPQPVTRIAIRDATPPDAAWTGEAPRRAPSLPPLPLPPSPYEEPSRQARLPEPAPVPPAPPAVLPRPAETVIAALPPPDTHLPGEPPRVAAPPQIVRRLPAPDIAMTPPDQHMVPIPHGVPPAPVELAAPPDQHLEPASQVTEQVPPLPPLPARRPASPSEVAAARAAERVPVPRLAERLPPLPARRPASPSEIAAAERAPTTEAAPPPVAAVPPSAEPRVAALPPPATPEPAPASIPSETAPAAVVLAPPPSSPLPLPTLPPGLESAEPKQDFSSRLVAAAFQQTLSEVTYDHRYVKLAYPMGDPPAHIGVCTDVIVRAYRGVGIDLQQLVHVARVGTGDTSMDHRRVVVLRRYFDRYAEKLPVSEFPEAYKPGDIVTFDVPWGRTSKWHIAIVSDVIGPNRRPLIIHNRGYGPKLEDALFHKKISGHYRFEPKSASPAAVAATPASPAKPVRLASKVKG
jgi:hypothetical protein